MTDILTPACAGVLDDPPDVCERCGADVAGPCRDEEARATQEAVKELRAEKGATEP